MFYLDWGREKAMIGVPKNRTQFDWVQLISKKAQWRSKSPPFSLLISSFVWPLVFFFFSPSSFKDVLLAALAPKQTFECSSHEGFGSLLSLQATRCWRPAPAEVEEEDWGGGGICAWQGMGRGASGSRPYMFAVLQLRINACWAPFN